MIVNQTLGAKVYCREGNSLDYILKYKNIIKYEILRILYILGGRFGSSHPLMKA